MPENDRTGETKNANGWPIYRDPMNRSITDPFDADETDWQPAALPTKQLWRCFTALQKLDYLLEGTSSDLEDKRRKRFLVQFVVPLHDFILCIGDLGLAIEKDTQSSLTTEELGRVSIIREAFKTIVFERSQKIKMVRDKIGAHTDNKLQPRKMAEIISSLDITMIGTSLHQSLRVFHDLCEFNCYAWSSKGYRENEFRLMISEPIVLTLSENDSSELIRFEITESPRRQIFEKILLVSEKSKWMINIFDCPSIAEMPS